MNRGARVIYVAVLIMLLEVAQAMALPAPVKAKGNDIVDVKGLTRRITVNILNNLGTGQQIALHCKSNDDDLGRHLIDDGGEYQFSFNLDFFGRSHFVCDFVVVKTNMQPFYFDAYLNKRDGANASTRRCYYECNYRIVNHYIYGYNDYDKSWSMMYAW